MNIQFFGGRGANLRNGGGKSLNIGESIDVWSYRHNPNNADFVDEINEGARAIQKEFPDIMNTVTNINAVELKGADSYNTLGFYSIDEKAISINRNYTNINMMNTTYDAAVKTGFHPSRGNKSGVEAVALHEMGHALTAHVGEKIGINNIDMAAESIVRTAYKRTKGRGGTKKWAQKISIYATDRNAECVAEAIADVFCNGKNAHSNSIAIFNYMKEING